MNKDYLRIKRAIEYLENNYQIQPGLEELSNAVHVSPYHLQRLFRRWAGVTPKQFLQSVTLKHTNKALHNGDSILDVTLNAGLSSSSRLHDLYINFHAMSPAQYRNKGQGLTIKFGCQDSPFGHIIIGMTEKGICNLQFTESISHSRAMQALLRCWPRAELIHEPGIGEGTVKNIFSNGLNSAQPINLHVGGTNFQIKVWQALLQIPFGEVRGYGQIAKTIHAKNAQRAVGSAIGKNPVAILIPCHRVIRATGVIGEYRWGTQRKQAVLTWERCRLSA